MPGIPLPSTDPGVTGFWRSARFCYNQAGERVVAGTARAQNGNMHRLLTCRFSSDWPPAAGDVTTLETEAVFQCSINARPDGKIDLLYIMNGTGTLHHRRSDDGGAAWTARADVPLGTVRHVGSPLYDSLLYPAPNREDLGVPFGHAPAAQQNLAHVYSRFHRMLVVEVYGNEPTIGNSPFVIAGQVQEDGSIAWQSPFSLEVSPPFGSSPGAYINALQELRMGALCTHGNGALLDNLKASGECVPTWDISHVPFGWLDEAAGVGVSFSQTRDGSGAPFLASFVIQWTETPPPVWHGGRWASVWTGDTIPVHNTPETFTSADIWAHCLRQNRAKRYELLRADTAGELGFLQCKKVGATGMGGWS